MLAGNETSSSSILKPVFYPAVVVILVLVIATVSSPDTADQFFQQALHFVTTHFGWFYMLAVAIFLVFIIAIAFSPWGNIKLGPDHAEPEYSFTAWFAMLFSAGYGIALLFFGVAEPVTHFASPPVGAPETVDAAKNAMQIAFFHWGFHIWAIYGVVGLSLAYFTFRHGLPLSMRSTLYPFIGDKIYGPIGHAVDVFSILGTLFGIATTLGLSVAQINAGLHYLWPSIPQSTFVQTIMIVLITIAATASVVAGMDKGVKRLSMLNIALAVALMVFVFIVGPSIFILETFLQNTGSYLSNIVERTFSIQAYSSSDWIGNWTLFIFGWTIAWAPFVGLFIAKISRGRTIRQFVIGVMLVPTLFTFVWFSIFGDTALHMIMYDGYSSLITDVQQDKAIALFKLFERLPFTQIVSLLTVLLIITFFVTSSDSGSLVIDSLASGGQLDTPVWQRVFWASTEGIVAIVLLQAGGLSALQTASVVSALPFAIIMLVGAAGLWRALMIEGHSEQSLQAMPSANSNVLSAPGVWRRRLAALVDFPEKTQVMVFIETTVFSAMKKVEKELLVQQWPCDVRFDSANERVLLCVEKPGQVDFVYEVRLCEYAKPDFAEPLESNEALLPYYYRAEVFLRRGGQVYDVYGYEEQDVINDILDQFEKYLHFLHISPGILPWNMEQHDDALSTFKNDEN